MALQGTLKDFGIADIFQLIGQQTKTGVLHLKSRDEEVHIAFSSGSIVRADSASRRERDLLGAMLLNGGLISKGQLDAALEVQRRTLQRLGDILIEKRFLQASQLKEMYQLQVTETIYRLFSWKTGTYQFEQGAVEFDPDMISPIRSESVLMEGFRRVDEWPSIRRVIPSVNATFERLKALPPPGPAAEASEDFDDAFGGERSEHQGGGPGPTERQVFELALPGMTAEAIADLSHLGEFESHKALLALINGGYLKVQAEVAGSPAGAGRRPPRRQLLLAQAGIWATRVAVSALVVLVVLLISYLLDAQRAAGGRGRGRALADATAQHLRLPAETEQLARAIGVFRLEQGSYPGDLAELGRSGIVDQRRLRPATGGSYYYRRTAEGSFLLLPPIQ